MSQENAIGKSLPDRAPTAAEASRALMRRALKGALATLEPGSGVPYASLVTVSTEPDGTPLLLLSRLAVHTRNLLADPRASLMIDGTGLDGDPLAGGRVTLVGTLRPTASDTARRRFLARHPGAEVYVDFPDFRFFAFAPERAHYIGGFGRIVDLGRDELVRSVAGSEALVAAEAEIVAHMNADHADALRLYATALLGAPDGDWRMTGIDPGGCDLVAGGHCLRLDFDERLRGPGDARRVLSDMSMRARRPRST